MYREMRAETTQNVKIPQGPQNGSCSYHYVRCDYMRNSVSALRVKTIMIRIYYYYYYYY
jgi:hypothetical protein